MLRLIILQAVITCIATGCASPENPPAKPRIDELVVEAVNSQDWKRLEQLTRPDMRANNCIKRWKTAPVRIRELKDVQPDSQWDGKPCKRYSFAMEYADGKLHPHQFQIYVVEQGTESKLLDFVEFGW